MKIPPKVLQELIDAKIICLHQLVTKAANKAPGAGCSDTACREALRDYIYNENYPLEEIGLEAFSKRGDAALKAEGDRILKAWTKFVEACNK